MQSALLWSIPSIIVCVTCEQGAIINVSSLDCANIAAAFNVAGAIA
jgi:hypothetical protein